MPFPVTNIRFNDEMVQEAITGAACTNASILECEAVGSDVDNCSNLLMKRNTRNLSIESWKKRRTHHIRVIRNCLARVKTLF